MISAHKKSALQGRFIQRARLEGSGCRVQADGIR